MMKRVLFSGLAAAAMVLAAAPQRIISASPNLTEILYGVGAFGRVVAVSDYCTYPPAVKKLPRIGGWNTPRLEAVAALRPDLVILAEAQAPFVADQLQQLGIRTLITPSRTVEDVFRTIAEIGAATGNVAQAGQLAAGMHARLERIRQRVRALPRPRVLCIVSRTPGTLQDLYAATPGSYLAELIETAGGSVVPAAQPEGYGKISQEMLVNLNPDVILDLVHGQAGSLAEDPAKVWRDLAELKAVRTGRLYPIEPDFVVHASQFIVNTAALFARLLHPAAVSGSGEEP